MNTVGRIGRYIEIIDSLPEHQDVISSQELATLVGTSSSTVRHDFHNHNIKKGTNPKITGLVRAARPKKRPEKNLFFREG